ncbi:hypothetical protein KO353_11420 [Elioraea tepida]|uniref:Uncharacterized protein n=1 Tax=Elioraea tepida TaxID=2843330 RepID=A0A975U2I1_9PROT|nr:hypothetical protein [Elioraea tepida]QXM23901.1 hypothetical protein KO353_11420 [Elioraea tepida]
MEAWQVFGLVASAAMLAILWPRLRRMLAEGDPLLRWAALWAAALLAVVLAHEWLLAPLGLGLR